MKITIFTPTYNRYYTIQKLFESLKKQTYTDFEWIVVDDGSTDHTEMFFQGIKDSFRKFPVLYVKTSNGGKHRAINRALPLASGEMFFIVDSDDFLPADALEQIIHVEATIPSDKKNHFAGICGQKAHIDSHPVGTTFMQHCEYLDITMLEREKYQITGDKAEVFYTEILKKYPFPEFDGENFLTECIVWDKIAYDGYQLRFFNTPIYYCEYLEDGLTKNQKRIYEKNPKGYGLYISQCNMFKKYDKAIINGMLDEYLRSHKGQYSYPQLAEFLNMPYFSVLWYAFFPYGVMLPLKKFFRKIFGDKVYEKIKHILGR